MSFTAKFTWHGSDLLRLCGLEEGGRVQQAIDKAIIDYDLQYVPWKTGVLGQSAYSATEIGSGKIVYPGPYAHYQYYGEVYGPNIPVLEDSSGIPTRYFSKPGMPKHPTGRALTYDTSVNALAGSRWFERMVADHREDIIEEARNAINNR